MASRKTSFVRLQNFGKGLVTIRPPQALDPGEAQEAENVDVSQGTVKRRSGWTPVHTAALPVDEPVTTLHAHYPVTGSAILFATVGGRLLSSEGGDFITEAAGFAPNGPVYAQFKATQAQVYIASAYGSNRTSQTLKKYDAGVVSTVAGAPSCSLIETFNDALWVAGDSNDPSTISFSRIFPNQETWPALNTVQAGKGDGDKITGMARVLNALIVFKERSIYRITGTQPDNSATDTGDLALVALDEEAGCIAPNSVAATSSEIIYLSRTGIFAFNGFRAKELSEAIRPLFATLSEASLKNASGALIAPHEYVLALRSEDSLVPDLVIHMVLRPQLAFTLWTGLEAYSWEKFRFSDGTTVPVFGTQGQVGRMGADTDNGTPIAWKYTTGILNLGVTPNKTLLRRGWVEAKLAGDSMTVEGLPDFANEGVKHSQSLALSSVKGESGKRIPFGAMGFAYNWALRFSGRGTGDSPEITEALVEIAEKVQR